MQRQGPSFSFACHPHTDIAPQEAADPQVVQSNARGRCSVEERATTVLRQTYAGRGGLSLSLPQSHPWGGESTKMTRPGV